MQTVSLRQAHIMVWLEEALNPPLKWAGGKRWLVPKLAGLYFDHRHRRLVEPFAGGLAISLALRPELALVNDVNYHLINFYRQVKLHGLPLHGRTTNVVMAYDKDLYYRNRERFNQISTRTDCAREAAELFYYLNRTCYNGLCRFNAKGGFNTPFGQYTTVNYASDFKAYQDAFKHWQFDDKDFRRLEVKPDDFIYADPPYDVEFTTYSAGGFNFGDQEALCEWLTQHPGPVVVSNQATERIIKLYSNDFDVRILEAPRRISNTGDRTPAQEMLAIRNL